MSKSKEYKDAADHYQARLAVIQTQVNILGTQVSNLVSELDHKDRIIRCLIERADLCSVDQDMLDFYIERQDNLVENLAGSPYLLDFIETCQGEVLPEEHLRQAQDKLRALQYLERRIGDTDDDT